MASSGSERDRLQQLLAAVTDARAAARLPAGDPTLVGLARHHRLTPLLSAEQGPALPAPLADSFRRDRLVTLARNMMLAQVAGECVQALAEAGIRAIVLKGLDYEARLYGAPGVRPTSDVDLMVPNQARRAAFTVLDRLGFEPRAAAPGFDDADYHEVAWTRAGVEVDLHMGLAPFARCRIDYGAVWDRAEPLALGRTEAFALNRSHAAVFHGLHMAIDHFAVPAIYLIDLSRLLPTPGAQAEALDVAARWRCARPLATSLALAAAFLPSWPNAAVAPPMSRRIIATYGAAAPLPRAEQLVRKVLHFDTSADLARYVAVQSLRNLREIAERKFRGRSARERLRLGEQQASARARGPT